MKFYSLILAALPFLLAACAAGGGAGATDSLPSTPAKSGFAPVNGLQMYYEIHGDHPGTPLVLLHGGGSTIDSTFGRVLPLLAHQRTVIALEEQAHGRTSDRAAPVRFESSADDVAALLAQLHVAKADLFGFSNGAGVALQVAIRHPEVVRKIVFGSFFTKKAGGIPQLWTMLEHADFSEMPQELKDAFLKVNPDPMKLRTMHDKDVDRMLSFRDVDDALLRQVTVPILVMAGDQDVVTVDHAAALAHTFPHARLLVVPGGHGDYFGEISAPRDAHTSRSTAMVAGVIDDFLNEPVVPAK